ncbi:MAG: sortase, partial [Candidatus Paceibacterota bacterium]
DYARIFSLLSVLDIGDVITVVVDGKRLRYEVYDTQVMSPDKVNSFVNQPTGDSELILVTCYPIGSASSRTVVSARLIQR